MPRPRKDHSFHIEILRFVIKPAWSSKMGNRLMYLNMTWARCLMLSLKHNDNYKILCFKRKHWNFELCLIFCIGFHKIKESERERESNSDIGFYEQTVAYACNFAATCITRQFWAGENLRLHFHESQFLSVITLS